MCKVHCGLRVFLGVVVLVVLTASTLAQQVALPLGEDDSNQCRESGTLTVTVSDESGGVIQNAFVLFLRVSRGRAGNTKDFHAERWTDSKGQATTDVTCGYVDVFVEAPGFNPQVEKVLMQRKSFAGVRLKIRPETDY